MRNYSKNVSAYTLKNYRKIFSQNNYYSYLWGIQLLLFFLIHY